MGALIRLGEPEAIGRTIALPTARRSALITAAVTGRIDLESTT
jgi:hypothetical protein